MARKPVEFRFPKQAKYPKKVYFSDTCYTIRFKKNLDCYGLTDPEKKVITLKQGMSERALFTTFLHELLHLIEFEHPVKLKHKTVYALEKAIFELLVDNFL